MVPRCKGNAPIIYARQPMVVPIYSRTHPTLAGVTSHVIGHQSEQDRGRFFDRHRVLRFRVGQHPTAELRALPRRYWLPSWKCRQAW